MTVSKQARLAKLDRYEAEWKATMKQVAGARRARLERQAGALVGTCDVCGVATISGPGAAGRSVQHTDVGRVNLCRLHGLAARRVSARLRGARRRAGGPRLVEARSRSATTKGKALTISGLGSPYGVTERIGGYFEDFDEVFAVGAWKRSISRPGADIVSAHNHDVGILLGRTSAGTLKLEDTKAGLVYRTTINPRDRAAKDVYERVARRDIAGASVMFTVTDEEWEDPTAANGREVPLRTVRQAELFEVGPVVWPAFPSTTAVVA